MSVREIKEMLEENMAIQHILSRFYLLVFFALILIT